MNSICYESPGRSDYSPAQSTFELDHPRPLGPFGKKLASPLVTLVVGRSKTQLHAHAEILTATQMPFYQNALKNLSKNVEMRINMPDEDPEIVSKMIEFMYKGDYTPPPSVEDDTASPAAHVEAHLAARLLNSAIHNDEPVARRAHPVYQIKLFHAQVYVLGERYGYTDLCKLAQKNVRRNLIYHGPELLEYMVGVYEMTGPKSALRIANMIGDGEGKFKHGTAWGTDSMKQWVSAWWKADGGILGAREGHGKILEAFERSPELARDLLALVCEVEPTRDR